MDGGMKKSYSGVVQLYNAVLVPLLGEAFTNNDTFISGWVRGLSLFGQGIPRNVAPWFGLH